MAGKTFNIINLNNQKTLAGKVTVKAKARLIEFSFDNLEGTFVMSYEQARDHVLQPETDTLTMPLVTENIKVSRPGIGMIAMSAFLDALAQPIKFHRTELSAKLNGQAVTLIFKGILDIDQQTVLASAVYQAPDAMTDFAQGHYSQEKGAALSGDSKETHITFTNLKQATLGAKDLGNFINTFFTK